MLKDIVNTVSSDVDTFWSKHVDSFVITQCELPLLHLENKSDDNNNTKIFGCLRFDSSKTNEYHMNAKNTGFFNSIINKIRLNSG